jgi:outer membrane immunogenic protein
LRAKQRVIGSARPAFAGVTLSTNPAATDSKVEAGWTAGAGIEYAFADMWTAKIEYLFADFGKMHCQAAAIVVCGGSVTLTENVVRGGINFKFNW